ncbi:MAG: DUF2064 domain-containing protein, partial [Afipia sp.]|nr:DUF2064 domain-containing protein [Afipia sp.]
RVAHDRRWTTVLAVDPPRARGARFWPDEFARRPQCRGDLGERMRDQFRQAGQGCAVLIGSDIPRVSAHLVAKAFAALHSHDAVFGPAEDGGFWLVGLRAGYRPTQAFKGVRWSGPHALEDSRASLAACQIALIDTLFDVDEVADWRRWRSLPLIGEAR